MTLSSLMVRFRPAAALSYGERIRPVRDWLFVLGVSAALAVATVPWEHAAAI